MTDSYNSLSIMSSNILNVQPLLIYLQKFNNTLYYDSDNTNLSTDIISFKVLPNIILNLKKNKQDHMDRIISSMKVSCNGVDTAKSVLKVIKDYNELFIISEIISHGLTYFDVREKIVFIIEYIENFIDNKSEFEAASQLNEIVQVILEDLKLEYLVTIILNNAHKKIVFTPSESGNSALSCFVLLTLLYNENPLLINQIIFAFPENERFLKECVICTQNWVFKNHLLLKNNENVKVEFNEKKSCFLVLDDCDLFSSVLNYLNSFGNWSLSSDKPQLCLVQENIYENFLSLLKSELKKSKNLEILDLNRQLSLSYIDDIATVLELIKSDKNIENLSYLEPISNSIGFFLPFILNQIQPQHKIFYDKSAGKLCSFILTFRTCEEGIMLANKIYRHKACLYLWTENVSQCFEIKSKVDYDEICINMITKPHLSQRNYKMICNSSIFQIHITNDSNLLSSSEIISMVESFRNRQENHRFPYRYKRIMKIISSDELKKYDDSLKKFKSYVENNLRNSQSAYEINGVIHTLVEKKGIGCVILYLGEVSVNDLVIQLVLMAWLLGNSVLVISANDCSSLQHSLIEVNKMKSIIFMQGRISISDLVNCSIDSVITLDELKNNNGFAMETMKFLFLYKCIDSVSNVIEFFDEVSPFLCKRKCMFIMSGGITTR